MPINRINGGGLILPGQGPSFGDLNRGQKIDILAQAFEGHGQLLATIAAQSNAQSDFLHWIAALALETAERLGADPQEFVEAVSARVVDQRKRTTEGVERFKGMRQGDLKLAPGEPKDMGVRMALSYNFSPVQEDEADNTTKEV